MKKQYLIEMDTETKKLSNELLETYSINDLQELLNALNTDVFKELLFQHMFENLDGNNPICPYCGSKHIRKHGYSPKKYTHVLVKAFLYTMENYHMQHAK